MASEKAPPVPGGGKGFLRNDLYGRDRLHLSLAGKRLMAGAIVGFQKSCTTAPAHRFY